MLREFLIYSQLDGTCSTRAKEGGDVHESGDFLEALAYIREETGDEPVRITALDCTGKVAFSTALNDHEAEAIASGFLR
jgi:hypothetical protein